MRYNRSYFSQAGSIFSVFLILNLTIGCVREGKTPRASRIDPKYYSKHNCAWHIKEAGELSLRAHRFLQLEPKEKKLIKLLENGSVAVTWPNTHISQERIDEGNNVEGLMKNIADVRGEMHSLLFSSRKKDCPIVLANNQKL